MLHSLRARNDGVLIGIKTLFADQPQLTVRDQLLGSEIEYAQTRPIIIDSNLNYLKLNPNEIRITRPILCCSLPNSHPLFLLARSKVAEIGGTVISCKSDHQGR